MTETKETWTEKSGPAELDFPKPQGEAFAQFSPKTGWLWVGLKIGAFDYEGAKAFLSSMDFQLWSIYHAMKQAATKIISAPVKVPENLRK